MPIDVLFRLSVTAPVAPAQVNLKVYKALGSDKDYVAFSQRFTVAHPGTRPGECHSGRHNCGTRP